MSGTSQRALVLDFGGVISRTMFETHRLSEKALGLPAGTLTWMGPFAAPGDDALWEAMQRGEISERDYWLTRTRETGALVGKKWSRMDEFVKTARGGDPLAIIRPEALSAIQITQRAGCRLAILSNELDLFYGADFRDRLPFLAAFDIIIDATYSNILKPDHRAYKAVCDALELAPQDCVFVDDQMKNVLGARDFGMKVVQFDVKNPARSYREALDLLSIPSLETTS